MNAVGYAKHRSRSHHAVIRVYDERCNVIETHKHKGEFKEFQSYSNRETVCVRLYYRGGVESPSVE